MLPKIDQPLFDLTIPSTKQKVHFRPFTVKEEKLLLIAQQANDDLEMIKAIMQVVNNCVQDDSFRVERLATFDLEYMFIKIRARSVNNIIKVAYRDNEDNEVYNFEIDADELEVEVPEKLNDLVKLNDDTGIKLKFPPASIVHEAKEFEDSVELMMFFIIHCLDEIYQGEELYNAVDFSYEEKKAFVEELPASAFDQMKVFFEGMPKLRHELTYKNKLGNDRKIVMDSIRDFFTWG